MKWNFDEAPVREGTDCVKYDLRTETFGTDNIIPLWVADMDFKTPDFIVDALNTRLKHEIYGYSFKPDNYFNSIINWLQVKHNWPIRKEWICFSPGIVPALNFCTLAFTQPGDSIIVQPPVYFPFFSAVKSHGRNLVYNQLREIKNEWHMDLNGLKKNIDRKTRMVFLCNPHNPIGKVWKQDELIEFANICTENNILILSDEIHSDLVLPGNKHCPVASLGNEIAENTITCIAPSKTFNLAGLSTSSVIISNPVYRSAFNNLVGNLHVGNGNIFGTIASIAAYSKGHQWLEELLLYLKGNIDYVIDYFDKRVPVIKPLVPEATYMVWLDCRNLKIKGKELNSFFITQAGVGMNEGSTFGPGGEGFMRMNVACPLYILKEAMGNIEKAVNSLR
jgi:cysteine-S-conjugate beta-lyase